MKCKYCNAMNPDGMPVCLYCARPLVEIDQKEKKEEIQEEKAKKKAEKVQKRNKKKETSSDSLDGTIESENGYAVNNDRYYDNVQPEEMADTSATPKVFAAKAFSLIGAVIAVALLLIYYFG